MPVKSGLKTVTQTIRFDPPAIDEDELLGPVPGGK